MAQAHKQQHTLRKQSLYKQYASHDKGSGMKKGASVSPATSSSTSIGNIGNSAKEANIKFKENKEDRKKKVPRETMKSSGTRLILERDFIYIVELAVRNLQTTVKARNSTVRIRNSTDPVHI